MKRFFCHINAFVWEHVYSKIVRQNAFDIKMKENRFSTTFYDYYAVRENGNSRTLYEVGHCTGGCHAPPPSPRACTCTRLSRGRQLRLGAPKNIQNPLESVKMDDFSIECLEESMFADDFKREANVICR